MNVGVCNKSVPEYRCVTVGIAKSDTRTRSLSIYLVVYGHVLRVNIH